MNNLLFDNEKIITQSDKEIVTLTTHRVRYNDSVFGKSRLISIMLEKISSIELHYKSNVIVLFFAIIAIGFGLFAGVNNNGEIMGMALIGGAVLLLFYFLTRKQVLTITSDSGVAINFKANGMSKEKILEFMNKVEKAKNDISSNLNR